MTKSLVIVESPAKAKTINKYLGKDFQVEASVGHVIDLPKSKIGVDFKNGFKPQYVTISGKKKVIDSLKEKASKADRVYLATDPDREGEAIAWHIENTLKEINPNIFRVEFNEITKNAIKKALDTPRQVDLGRVNSQQARRILDRIVGYKVSPFLWKSVYKGLSAGRVQSVALRLICEREAEIKKFKPEEFWTFDAIFQTEKKEEISCRLEKIDNKKANITNEKDAKEHLANMKSSNFKVSKVEKKKLKRNAPPPFITSTMQQEAVRRLRMTSKRVMSTAQSLYEGIKIGDHDLTGLITYMRTDSVRISNEAVDAVRTYIKNDFGDRYLPEKAKFYKSKKSAQDAHEAIRPTQINKDFSPSKIKQYLNNDQFRLYHLIWSRFLASQMNSVELDKTNVEISDNKYIFKCSGEIVTFDGYLAAYPKIRHEDDEHEENADIPASIKQNDPLNTKKIDTKQNFTKPPARYNESSIIKTLDELGIGRPSTYSQIITTLLGRNYVENIERRMHATELGETVNKILIEFFPDLFKIEFTADMENKLDDIENNQAEYETVLKNFYSPFETELELANSKTKEIKSKLQVVADIKCDKCEGDMLVKMSRNGKFLACANYPSCKNTLPLDKEGNIVKVETVYSDHSCEKCQSKMIIKTGPYGKYLACENKDDCGFRRPMPTGITCPKCEKGEVGPRRSKKGRTFYGCSNYPDCDFVSWSAIENKDCPNEDSKYMLKKFTKAKGEFLQCPECKEVVSLENQKESAN